MSPAVEQIRRTVEARLRELSPVIIELEQLQSILVLLDAESKAKGGNGVDAGDLSALLAQVGNGDGAAPDPAPPRRSRRGTKPGRDGRAPQGSNKKLIVDTVMSDPGITATEIAERTGVKRTVVSATLNRLKRNGELEADGRGVRIPLAVG